MKKFKVRIEGKEYHVEVERETEERVERGAEKKETIMKEKEPFGKYETYETITSKEKTITAPMPAKAIKVNCKAGERVKKGDVLVILEAMKMENEIHSPIDGTIKEVMIQEGGNVSQDEIMVRFD
jgi:biotin carboxyl carrier protein